jgi:hypothetical protein
VTRAKPTYLLDRIVVLYRQQPRREQHLQLLDDDVAGLVDANQGGDDIACLTRPEL